MLIRTSWITALLVLVGTGLAQAAPLQNQLRQHASPYLALHGSDPVAWQEWNSAAVERARRSDKLLYVSIGYFSCHWCHVMQRESYRNAEIARFLNEHMIPVKVDRELEPALDARLIDFVERTRGISGWPLNVFVTPDGHPLYATLYHPPAEFLQILKRLEQLWRQDRDRLGALARLEEVQAQGPGKPEVNAEQARAWATQVVEAALKNADTVQGGFGDQGKFPQVPQLSFLLEQFEKHQDARLKEFLLLTLDAMADYGMQDHLDGGFFRYTVDPSWKTPHFEKMLYDNAQLARLYRQAARVLDRAPYRQIADRTLEFMLRELRDDSGAFISALSALDDRGVEGGYYLWESQQLDRVLNKDESATYRLYAGMQGAPGFAAGYLPVPQLSVKDVATQRRLDEGVAARQIAAAEAKLRQARRQRVVPRDTKQLAAWNGLALVSFVEAAQETKNPRYRDAARALRDYLVNELWDGKALVRSRVQGKASGKVAVEDYAYVAAGLNAWAQLTGAASDRALAVNVVKAAWQRFYSATGYRLEENSLLTAEPGQDVLSDGTMPSPSAVLAAVSLELAARQGDAALRRQALSALNSGAAVITANPFWYATPVSARLNASASRP